MGKRASDYMRDVSKIRVATDTRMTDVLQLMVEQNTTSVVVVDVNLDLKGIITGTDILRELERDLESSRLLEGIAEHVMTRRIISVTDRTLMIDAADQMFRGRFHTLVVTRDFEPVGIITQLDIARWWLEEYGHKT